jgi:hypothetical protein
MAKYIIRVSQVVYAYAETEIEAESEAAAEDIAWEMIYSGELELEQTHGDMEVDVQEAEDE